MILYKITIDSRSPHRIGYSQKSFLIGRCVFSFEYRIRCDEIDKINGKQISIREFRKFRQDWVNSVKTGDKVRISVYRKTINGKTQKKTLKAKAFKSNVRTFNSISFNPNATEYQTQLQKIWLYGKP